MINKESYGVKADCWAFGCILYTLATGSPPFEGNHTNDTLKKVAQGKFEIPKSMSPVLADLISKLLNWD
jgi:serine/threonine protein kinase